VCALIFSVGEVETPDHFKLRVSLDGQAPLLIFLGLLLLSWLDFALLERLITQVKLIKTFPFIKQENSLTQSKQLLIEELFVLIPENKLNLFVHCIGVTLQSDEAALVEWCHVHSDLAIKMMQVALLEVVRLFSHFKFAVCDS
jgi:hypothetical protein